MLLACIDAKYFLTLSNTQISCLFIPPKWLKNKFNKFSEKSTRRYASYAYHRTDRLMDKVINRGRFGPENKSKVHILFIFYCTVLYFFRILYGYVGPWSYLLCSVSAFIVNYFRWILGYVHICIMHTCIYVFFFMLLFMFFYNMKEIWPIIQSFFYFWME